MAHAVGQLYFAFRLAADSIFDFGFEVSQLATQRRDGAEDFVEEVFDLFPDLLQEALDAFPDVLGGLANAFGRDALAQVRFHGRNDFFRLDVGAGHGHVTSDFDECGFSRRCFFDAVSDDGQVFQGVGYFDDTFSFS